MRRFRGPIVSDQRRDQRREQLAAGRRAKAEWLRFEIECRKRCDKLETDIYATVNSLLISGKKDQSTRPQIETLIRYQEQIERVQFEKSDIKTLCAIYERIKTNGKSKNN